MSIKNIYKLPFLFIPLLIMGCNDRSESNTDYQADTPDIAVQQFESELPTLVAEPIKSMPSVPRPLSGTYNENFDEQQAIAPLEIRTDAGADYYVKVVNTANDIDTLTIYIRGGETIEVEVPLGNYEIRYASGDNWYGDEELFGADTSFNKADELFDFVETNYQISGYTITLYQVVDGNLETKSINKDQF